MQCFVQRREVCEVPEEKVREAEGTERKEFGVMVLVSCVANFDVTFKDNGACGRGFAEAAATVDVLAITG